MLYIMGRLMKYTCPCCGYNTFDEPVKGTYDIGELCGWEDDWVCVLNLLCFILK
ncbi:CPCC family cysteine-rich protein [Vibrio neptunius]|uniref:CPCC family cysteine-rich protein n=1 Tax=Vibrio neptunius TaxID=170651 RepID=UPI003B8A74ED